MADVLFVCVREDLDVAEALAGAIDGAGFSIDADTVTDASIADNRAVLVVLSSAAMATQSFRVNVERAVRANKAIFVSLTGQTPLGTTMRVFDLADWDGQDEAPLGELLAAIARAARLGHSTSEPRQRGRVIDLAERVYTEEVPIDEADDDEPEDLHWDKAWLASLPSTYLGQRGAR